MHSLQLPSFTQNKIFVSQQRASPTTSSPPKKPPVVNQLVAGVTSKTDSPRDRASRSIGLLGAVPLRLLTTTRRGEQLELPVQRPRSEQASGPKVSHGSSTRTQSRQLSWGHKTQAAFGGRQALRPRDVDRRASEVTLTQT